MNQSGRYIPQIVAIYQQRETLIDTLMQRQAKAYAGESISEKEGEPSFSIYSIDSRENLKCEKFSDYTKFRAAYPNSDTRAARVAVLGVMGVIEKTGPEYQPYYVSTQKLIRNIEMCVADPDISAVVLYFDSPGGLVDGTEYAARMIAQYNKLIPIYSQVSGMCASAAYWLASQTRGIYADSKADQIGSIGVMSTHASYKRLYENEGIDVTVLTSDNTPDKAIGNRFEILSDEDKEKITDELTAVKTLFTSTVIEGRGDKLKNQEAAFSGAVYLAAQSQKIGLIDGISPLKDTVLKAFKDSTKKPMSASNSGKTSWLSAILPTYKVAVTEDVTLTAAEATQLTQEVENLRSANASLRADLEALKPVSESAAKTTAEAARLFSELTAANDSLSTLKAELDQVKAELSAKATAFELLEAAHVETETALKDAKAQAETLTAEKSDLTGKLETLTAEYNKLSKNSAGRIIPTVDKEDKPKAEKPEPMSPLAFASLVPSKGTWKSN